MKSPLAAAVDIMAALNLPLGERWPDVAVALDLKLPQWHEVLPPVAAE